MAPFTWIFNILHLSQNAKQNTVNSSHQTIFFQRDNHSVKPVLVVVAVQHCASNTFGSLCWCRNWNKAPWYACTYIDIHRIQLHQKSNTTLKQRSTTTTSQDKPTCIIKMNKQIGRIKHCWMEIAQSKTPWRFQIRFCRVRIVHCWIGDQVSEKAACEENTRTCMFEPQDARRGVKSILYVLIVLYLDCVLIVCWLCLDCLLGLCIVRDCCMSITVGLLSVKESHWHCQQALETSRQAVEACTAVATSSVQRPARVWSGGRTI
jgi:hypothetical protein